MTLNVTFAIVRWGFPKFVKANKKDFFLGNRRVNPARQ